MNTKKTKSRKLSMTDRQMQLASTANKLAKRFSELLLKEVGKEKMAEIIELNKQETNTIICHSHDFCDANMPMARAFRQITGKFPQPHSDLRTELWSKAWDIAKKNHFFVEF